jgi:hypothetical protein
MALELRLDVGKNLQLMPDGGLDVLPVDALPV